jgi:hypothetical protein
MDRQPLRHALTLSLLVLAGAARVFADTAAVDALSPHDAASGLRSALSKGIDVAVAQLGKPGGFLNDPKVAIPLPPALEKADHELSKFGMGKQGEEIRTTMNHAAEEAVAQAGPIFKDALHHMTLSDAKAILTGGDGAATAYFRRATTEPLTAKFKPVVAAETAKLGVTAKYDEYAGKAAQLGLIKSEDANINDYVTAKALDGLFSRVADEEHEIRKDPLKQTSALLRKVFGAL